MKQLLLFILLIVFIPKSFGQFDSNVKFKPIPPKKEFTKPNPEKEIPASKNLFKLNFPKIVAPNIFKETNIFGTKAKVDNSFEIGTPENHFSMTIKNKFQHKLGDVYQQKMTQDLDRTMIREELKEDKSLLDRNDRYLGEYKTKSKFLTLKYRDYIVIDGDLINVYVNGKLLRSGLYMNDDFGEFRIPLSLGFNDIELVVASTGTSGGNTAELHVLDDLSRDITTEYWNNLALGVKIKMIFVKE